MKKLNNAPRMFIELEVRDKNGRLIKRYEREGHSWVGNVIRVLWLHAKGGTPTTGYYVCSGIVPQNPVATSGYQVNWFTGAYYPYGNVGMSAGADDDSFGILVGSDDTPVSLSDYNLKSQIGNSVLSHGATTLEDITYGDTYYFRIIRQFSNNSGSTVTVKEMGLFFKNANMSFMFARDVISPSIDVPDGGVLTCRYRIEQSLT